MASASVESLAGDLATAAAILEDACASLNRDNDRAWLATFTAALGDVVYEQGRWDEAFVLSATAEALAPGDDVTAQLLWRRVRAMAMARRGELVEAEQFAQDAVELSTTTDEPSKRAAALLSLAEVLHLASRTREARVAAAKAITLLEQKDDSARLAQARARLSDAEAYAAP
jgi:ATP/maltotriose-dependent transcriptional regulator MalT